jgi:hypothetical protein
LDNALLYQGAGSVVDSGGSDGTLCKSCAASDFLELAYAFEVQGRTSGGSQAHVSDRLIARNDTRTGHTIFDEWPIWPRSYFHSEVWLQGAFDAAFESKNQTRRIRRTLLDLMKAARNSLSRIDFEHPVTQPALWIGGVAMPLLILIAIFVYHR